MSGDSTTGPEDAGGGRKTGAATRPRADADSPGSAALPGEGRQLTLRAALTGMALGALLSVCNLYAALRIGLSFNMSITAALLGYGFWTAAHHVSGRRIRPLGLLENNINQTACSAGALVPSAGLVTTIPALTIVTGAELPWAWLALWVLSVCLVGIVVAIALRPQMLQVDNLPFPVGLACAETLRGLHGRGREALERVAALLAAAAAGALVPLLKAALGARLAAAGLRDFVFPAPGAVRGLKFAQLTLGAQLSPFLLGVGGLIGLRIGASLLLGAVVAFGLLAPAVVRSGHLQLTAVAPLASLPAGTSLAEIEPGRLRYDAARGRLEWRGWMSAAQHATLRAASSHPAYLTAVETLRDRAQPGRTPLNTTDLLAWLIWPGVTLMVVSALTSFAFSWRALAAVAGMVRRRMAALAGGPGADFGRSALLAAVLAVLALSVALQVGLFEIAWWAALGGVALSFALALVAARVSGEVGLTPVAQISKVTQLAIGVAAPQAPAANLMGASVAGGAASQCADLLHDLKCGRLLGAAPRTQAWAQMLGALGGAAVAAAAYLWLVPDPRQTLLTEALPAPGVRGATMVAELLQGGRNVLPPGAETAMLVAAAAGVLLALAEKLAPARLRPWMLSGTGIGTAFVIPAYYSITIFLGGLLALGLGRWVKSWSRRFLITVCTGLIVGDTLTEFVVALGRMAG